MGHSKINLAATIIAIVVGAATLLVTLGTTPAAELSENLRSYWSIAGGDELMSLLTSSAAIRVYKFALSGVVGATTGVVVALLVRRFERALNTRIDRAVHKQIEQAELTLVTNRLDDDADIFSRMTILENRIAGVETLVPQTEDLMGAIAEARAVNLQFEEARSQLTDRMSELEIGLDKLRGSLEDLPAQARLDQLSDSTNRIRGAVAELARIEEIRDEANHKLEIGWRIAGQSIALDEIAEQLTAWEIDTDSWASGVSKSLSARSQLHMARMQAGDLVSARKHRGAIPPKPMNPAVPKWRVHAFRAFVDEEIRHRIRRISNSLG